MTQEAAVLPISEFEQGYFDTWNIGGDRFAFLSRSMFDPTAFVGTTDPTTLAVLSVPPTYDELPIGGVNGSPGSQARAVGAANPWAPKASIVPWVLLGVFVGWLGIHVLYYHKRKR